MTVNLLQQALDTKTTQLAALHGSGAISDHQYQTELEWLQSAEFKTALMESLKIAPPPSTSPSPTAETDPLLARAADLAVSEELTTRRAAAARRVLIADHGFKPDVLSMLTDAECLAALTPQTDLANDLAANLAATNPTGA